MISIKINDWYNIHKGFVLNLKPGYTALVGPNGAGKTTLLRQIAEYADKNNIPCLSYSAIDFSKIAKSEYATSNKLNVLATLMQSSEGEQISINFGEFAELLGTFVRYRGYIPGGNRMISRLSNLDGRVNHKDSGKNPLEDNGIIILLDSLDSGASIDRIDKLRSLFDLISVDNSVYLVCSCNNFELVKGARCINPRNGKIRTFKTYETYAKFIRNYFDNYTFETVRGRGVRNGHRVKHN